MYKMYIQFHLVVGGKSKIVPNLFCLMFLTEAAKMCLPKLQNGGIFFQVQMCVNQLCKNLSSTSKRRNTQETGRICETKGKHLC